MIGDDDSLACALNYASRGWHVLPLVRGEKRPCPTCCPHGFKDATIDPKKIKAWYDNHPDDGIGIRAGDPGSPGMLDVDERNGGCESLAEMERKYGPLPKTVVCKSGSGGRSEHNYLNAPYLTKKCKLAPGIDWIPQDGYVVGPPSLHPSGGMYRWKAGHSPDDVEVATMPALWMALLTKADDAETKSCTSRATLGEVTDARVAILEDALSVIDPDCSRDIWIRIGMALEAEHAGEQLFAVWDRWSSTAKEKYPGTDELRRQWASFRRKDEEVTLKTLFHYALERGWRGGFEENADGHCNAWPAPESPAAVLTNQLLTPPRPTSPSWEDPVWVWERVKPPPFPLMTAYPEGLWWQRDYTSAISGTFQMPPDFVACTMLALSAGASQGRFVVTIPGYQWVEQSALWVLSAMPSGMGKSQAFRPLIQPFHEYELGITEEERKAQAMWESKMRLIETQVNASAAEMKKKASAALDDAELAQRLEEKDSQVMVMRAIAQASRPQSNKQLVSDASSEAMAEYLEDHNGRATLADPEGGAFDLALGSAQKPARLDVFLKAYDCETISEKRIGNALNPRSKERFVRCPSLSIAIATQPGPLAEMFKHKLAASKGFLARFLVSIVPPSLPAEFMRPGMLPSVLTAEWKNAVHRMLRAQRGDTPEQVVLSGEAVVEFKAWGQHRLELARIDDESKVNYLTAWQSKLRGKALRIALALHCMLHEQPAEHPISGETMRCALEWAGYFEGHHKAFMSETSRREQQTLALRILRWVCARYDRRDGSANDVLTRRDIQQSLAGGSSSVSSDELNEALAVLIDNGWLRGAGKVEREYGKPLSYSRFDRHPKLCAYVSSVEQ